MKVSCNTEHRLDFNKAVPGWPKYARDLVTKNVFIQISATIHWINLEKKKPEDKNSYPISSKLELLQVGDVITIAL